MSASVPDPSAPSTVRCRPHPGVLLFALLAFTFAALPWLASGAMRSVDDRVVAAIVGLAFGGFGLGLVIWFLVTRFEASADGLRWRTFRGAKNVLWSGVTDYYDAPPNGNRKLSRTVIKTTSGEVTLPEGVYTSVEALRAAVRGRATNAKARDWGILGVRPEDEWPKSFAYDARRLRRELWPVNIVTVAFLVFFAVTMGPKFARVIGEIGWGLGLAMVACALVAPLGLPLVMVCAVAPVREGLRRTGHRITLDPAGIAFEDGHRRIASSWSGVSGLRLVPVGGLRAMYLFVIATPGGDITFVRSIEDAVLLRAAVERFTGKTFALDDAGDRLTEPSPEEAMGVARVYSYRNRTARALLWSATALALIALVLSTLRYAGRVDSAIPGDPTGFILAALLAAFTAWAWWRYKTVHIRTDAFGITWTGPGRRVFISWSDVRACEFRKADMATSTTIRGSRDKIYVWFGISGYESLKAEVAARAPALAKGAESTVTPAR